MIFKQMTVKDIPLVLPIYLDYYNGVDGSCWTEQTATKRISQVLSINDGFSLLAFDGDEVVAFAMGFFKQYDDLLGYTLEEIVVSARRQNQGIGSALLQELCLQVGQRGASLVELISVNDEQHHHFYSKAGFKDTQNFTPKVKWLQS